MRLSEELARILPARHRRRAADRAPREIVPAEGAARANGAGRAHAVDGGAAPGPGDADAVRFDAARERLRAEIPPRDHG